MNAAPNLTTLLSTLLLVALWSCDGQLEQFSGAKEEDEGSTNVGTPANTNGDDDDTVEGEKKTDFENDFFKDGLDYHLVPIPAEKGDTKGTGGQKGYSTGTYDHNGMSADYAMDVPQDNGAKAHTVFVFFHGDGGGSPNTSLVKDIAASRSLIAFAMGTPTGDSWWVDQGPKNSDLLMSFIEDKLHKEYNVDTSRIYMAGSSGGSNFQTGMMLPRHGYKYAMTSINLCGGAQNMLEFFEFHEKIPTRTKIHFIRSPGDFLEEQIVDAIDYYNERSFDVTETTLSGSSGHCGFSAFQEITKILPK